MEGGRELAKTHKKRMLWKPKQEKRSGRKDVASCATHYLGFCIIWIWRGEPVLQPHSVSDTRSADL